MSAQVDENVEPPLPAARGPVSEALLTALRRTSGPISHPAIESIDALTDDAQLALASCYELHYRSFSGVDDSWEWDPNLLHLRAQLERSFVRRLEEEVGVPTRVAPEEVAPALRRIAREGNGPSLSRFMEIDGTFEQLREFCVHRSAYQLKEADPHTWMIPRLSGRAKAAAVTIQYDEYGKGSARAMHSTLFAETMRALDLDPTYGAYLDVLPAPTLATGNLVTMFGLHRRWRGACVGHLALFEMTSVQPMQRYSNALRRLAVDAMRDFYDVHVEADAWHEQIALTELVGGPIASYCNDAQLEDIANDGAASLIRDSSEHVRPPGAPVAPRETSNAQDVVFVGTTFVLASFAMYAEPLYRTTSFTPYATLPAHAPRQRKPWLGHVNIA